MMHVMPLIIFGVLLNTTGQILLKEGMTRIGEFAFSLHNVLPIGVQVMTSPFIIAGLACYGFSLMTWLLVLSRLDVSYAYPMVSLGYIVTVFSAYFLLHETITPNRIIGTMIIMMGVFVLSRA